MKILGIESSCDETACAVVEDGRKVLSNIVATSLEEHKLYGGVVPEIASRRHAESISGVVREALEKANCTMDDIDAVAVTYAPGLIGALLVGVNFAKGLAFASGTPLVPVHHLRGHIASNYISSDVKPPFLCLVVSGGHSHIVAVNDYTDFEIIGKTRDDAAGEALDKAGRTMGLAYPGGISIDIPVTVKIRKGWDDENITAVELAKIAEKNGAAAITVHGRTRMQMYSGKVDYDIIAKVKKAVDIPVIANGDIVDEQSAAIMFEKTNCDAIMIGRGALGNPWIFRRINAYLNECRVLPDVSINEKMVVMLKHIQKIIEYKGEYTAMREARHHAAYYTKGIRGGAALRKEISTFEHFEQLEELAYKIAKENE